MIKSIEKELECLDSKHAIEQYKTVLKLADQIHFLCQQDRSESNLLLAKRVKDKVHKVRFVISYNKATDIGTLDVELEKAWSKLIKLIDSTK